MSKIASKPNSGRQLMTFLVVGGFGFLVDAGLFFIFLHLFGLDILVSRALAFLPATLVTWWANRLFTFRPSADTPVFLMREYLKYLLVQSAGIAINFLVFYLMVLWLPVAATHTLLPLAAGSVIALLFNFSGARFLVFRH
jgi:putative flippase GtrA